MTTATAPTNLRTIHELRKYDGPLYIANNTPNRVICHEQLGDKRVDFELDPKGDTDSVMMLPKLALEVRGIQKMWLRNDVIISTDEAMEDQIALLLNQSVQAPQERLDAVMARAGEGSPKVEESITSKALVERACLQCGHTNHEGMIDRGRVIQPLRDVNDGVPPLCPSHTDLATQFTPRPVFDSEGNQSWEFDRVVVTAPVRERNT